MRNFVSKNNSRWPQKFLKLFYNSTVFGTSVATILQAVAVAVEVIGTFNTSISTP